MIMFFIIYIFFSNDQDLVTISPTGDQPGMFDLVIVNDDLERAFQQLFDFLKEVPHTSVEEWLTYSS